MSFTKLDFPAAFASEGDPMAGGFPGDYDRYVHTVNDTMDVDDETGHFSLDVSRLPSPFLGYPLNNGSTWHGSPNWRLLLPWNRRDGTINGGNSLNSATRSSIRRNLARIEFFLPNASRLDQCRTRVITSEKKNIAIGHIYIYIPR